MTKNRWLQVAGVVLAVGVIYFLATSVVPRVLVTLTKAAPGQRVSMANSLLIGEKLLAGADGVDECRLNVFLTDQNGKPVPGKQVAALSDDAGLEITPADLSDASGSVGFGIKSSKSGSFEIRAEVEGVEMPRRVKCVFR